VPLARAHDIFARAYAQVSGLARTARGPAMPTGAGTVCITGIADIGAQKAFVLRYTQASDPDLIGRPLLRRIRSGGHLVHRPEARPWRRISRPAPRRPAASRTAARHRVATGRRTRSARAALRPGSLVIARPALVQAHGGSAGAVPHGASRPLAATRFARAAGRREQQVSMREDMLPRRQHPAGQ
jgi:hypothetical protein